MFRKNELYLKIYFSQKIYKPLILRGARQVGKSTLVENFCRSADLKLITVNLETKKYQSLTSEDIDVDSFINEIETNFNVSLLDEKTLLFIDEIQAQPQAISYLRYFYEKYPKIKLIAAGSLLDFYLSHEKIAIPVGRINYLFVAPMTFTEFLISLKEEKLAEQVLNPFKLNQVQINKLSDYYKKYLFIGGMPEAVKTYIETNNLQKVSQVHKSLLMTYREDFFKYSKNSQLLRLNKVYDFMPLKIGKKIKYSEIDPDEKAANIKSCIDLLSQAQVVSRVFHTKASESPIDSERDELTYKCYFLDVGLVSAAQNIKWDQFITTDTDNKLNQGFIHEQFIAQHLLYKENGLSLPKLHYWLRDRSTSKAEVDFIIEYKTKIMPIEVKSVVGKMKSLFVYLAEKKIKQAIMVGDVKPEVTTEKVKIKTKDDVKTVSFELTKLPHFCVEYLFEE